MNDRGMKKWRPFNAVVPSRDLLKTEESLLLPNLSPEEIEEYEEYLKFSLYTHSILIIDYVENGKKKQLTDYVIAIEPIRKDIIFHSKKINFRQIIRVQK